MAPAWGPTRGEWPAVSPLHDTRGQSVPYAVFAGRHFLSVPLARCRGEDSCEVSSCCQPVVGLVLGTVVPSRSAHLGGKLGRRRGLARYRPCGPNMTNMKPYLASSSRTRVSLIREQRRDCLFQGCVNTLGVRLPLFLNKIQ